MILGFWHIFVVAAQVVAELAGAAYAVYKMVV